MDLTLQVNGAEHNSRDLLANRRKVVGPPAARILDTCQYELDQHDEAPELTDSRIWICYGAIGVEDPAVEDLDGYRA